MEEGAAAVACLPATGSTFTAIVGGNVERVTPVDAARGD
jgi:hypothetical protein